MKYLLLVLLMSGCATERFGRMSPLSEAEKTSLDCPQIRLEISKAESFMDDINNDEFGGANVLGILGDLGIGNAMEKSSALSSGRKRLEQLNTLGRSKGCLE